MKAHILVSAGRVVFLHHVWYGATFWFQEQNNVDNSLQLLLSSALQSQGHFGFSASHILPTVRRLEGHKKPGRDRTRTADLKQPKGYSIPYDIVGQEWLPPLRYLLGIGQWVVINCIVNLLFCI